MLESPPDMKLLIRLPIAVHPEQPRLCRAPVPGDFEGCNAFLYDEDGDPLCGAFMVFLAPAPAEQFAEDGWYQRCEDCLRAEVS